MSRLANSNNSTMTHHGISYEFIDKTVQDNMYKYINNNMPELVDSSVMIPESKNRYVDKAIRKSKGCTFISLELFDMANLLIEKMNNISNEHYFALNNNKIDYVEYGPGDYFDRHQDYTVTNHPSIAECSLLICLDADCDGGETVFDTGHGCDMPCWRRPYETKITKTKYGAIIFDKHTNHAGKKLESGFKKIIQINVFAVPLIQHPQRYYLLIKFNDTPDKYVIVNKYTLETLQENLNKKKEYLIKESDNYNSNLIPVELNKIYENNGKKFSDLFIKGFGHSTGVKLENIKKYYIGDDYEIYVQDNENLDKYTIFYPDIKTYTVDYDKLQFLQNNIDLNNKLKIMYEPIFDKKWESIYEILKELFYAISFSITMNRPCN